MKDMTLQYKEVVDVYPIPANDAEAITVTRVFILDDA
jgi:hypothetical protein